eukprot:427559_1
MTNPIWAVSTPTSPNPTSSKLSSVTPSTSRSAPKHAPKPPTNAVISWVRVQNSASIASIPSIPAASPAPAASTAIPRYIGLNLKVAHWRTARARASRSRRW